MWFGGFSKLSRLFGGFLFFFAFFASQGFLWLFNSLRRSGSVPPPERVYNSNCKQKVGRGQHMANTVNMHVSVVGRGGVMRVGPCSVWLCGWVRGRVRGYVARGGSGGPGGGQ